MDGFAAGKHLHQLSDASGARLGPRSRLDTPQYRVAIGGIDTCKEGLGRRLGLQCSLQILGHRGRTRTVVGPRPAPVSLGRLYLSLTRGLHAARFNECLYLVDIDSRPDTSRAPRREALKIVLIVKTFLLSIDPAPTQRNLHRFGVGDTGLVGASLGDLETEAFRSSVILLQPGLEGVGALEQGWCKFKRDDGFDSRHHLDLCGINISAIRGIEAGTWLMVG